MPQIGEIKHGRDLGKKQLLVKYIWLPCKLCGKERWVSFYHRTNMCRDCQLVVLHSNTGRKNPSWKGGRYVERYVHILLSKDDFFYSMADNRGYIFEHRYIMAKHLNRCLLSWEIVHHRNGIKTDNRLENLELLATSKQHLPDMLTRAKIRRLEKEVIFLKERITNLERGRE